MPFGTITAKTLPYHAVEFQHAMFHRFKAWRLQCYPRFESTEIWTYFRFYRKKEASDSKNNDTLRKATFYEQFNGTNPVVSGGRPYNDQD